MNKDDILIVPRDATFCPKPITMEDLYKEIQLLKATIITLQDALGCHLTRGETCPHTGRN